MFFLLGGEDTSMVSQTYDNSANNSAVYDDSVSVTSSNVQMELLTSKKSPSSGNISGQSESEDTHTSSSVRKEKKHKDKVSSCIFFFSEIYLGVLFNFRVTKKRNTRKRKQKTKKMTKRRNLRSLVLRQLHLEMSWRSF